MKFGQYLLHMLNNKNKTQTRVVCELQLKFDIFSSLDEITFSRWVNNKTTPSLEKQLLIAYHLEKKMSFFISNIDNKKCKKSLITKFDETFERIENSYHQINYRKSLKEDKTLSLMNMNKETHRISLGCFYNQFKIYKDIFSYIDNNKIDITTTVLAIKNNGEVISHISFNRNIEKIIPYVQKKHTSDMEKSISINIGYYSNKESYNILTGHLFCHLIDNFISINKIYVISNGKYFNDFLEELGGEICIQDKDKENIGDTYIFKFNFIQLLSNPFIFNQIKNSYNSFIELKKNLIIDIK
ncbi:hypothetical protein [Aliivibrio sifiae]|uniref:hypothetical protein n=1 Tax=Aliivibrio sifiae TaxID=566293 RepID=UPI00076ABC9E